MTFAVANAVPRLVWRSLSALTIAAFAMDFYAPEIQPALVTATDLVGAGLLGIAAWGNSYGLHYGLGDLAVRDASMMQQLDTYLEQNPDVDSMVALVGAAHAPGMVRHFRYAGYTAHARLGAKVRRNWLGLKTRFEHVHR